MPPEKAKGLETRFSGDLAEVQQQIQRWSSEAAELCPTLMAFALALSADASLIVFKGDTILLNARARRDKNVGLLTLDLAAVRRIVCNLKILEAQRKRLRARKGAPIATETPCCSSGPKLKCCWQQTVLDALMAFHAERIREKIPAVGTAGSERLLQRPADQNEMLALPGPWLALQRLVRERESKIDAILKETDRPK